jgi:hypothetical protein
MSHNKDSAELSAVEDLVLPPEEDFLVLPPEEDFLVQVRYTRERLRKQCLSFWSILDYALWTSVGIDATTKS